jgi:AmmeMemoRadiSam system protein A
LLKIARSTIEAHLEGHRTPQVAADTPGLRLQRGAFVTLHEKGSLRGCIGQFTSQDPLTEVVGSMAIAAASEDPRFSPVASGEMKDIHIEISVLSPPASLADWRSVRLGVDGVIVRRGSASGVFLPQVATETGWDLETFLGELCSQKAGLPRESYKDPATKIFTFQADVFSEEGTA